MKHMKLTLSALAVGTLALTHTSADADLLVYEGVQYGPAGQSLAGNPDDLGGADAADATGMSGTYAETGSANVLNIISGDLNNNASFSGLTTNGNHAGATTSSGETRVSRTITASLGGTNDIWFSVVLGQFQSGGAGQGGIVVSNAATTDNEVKDIDTTGFTGDGFGIGANSTGSEWLPYAWDGGVESVGTGLARTTSKTYLFLGHIDVGGGTAGNDLYTLYDVTGDVSGSYTKNLVGTIDIDISDSTLNTFTFSRRTQARFDEFRIATTETEALGLIIPEPSSLALLAMGGILIARRRRG